VKDAKIFVILPKQRHLSTTDKEGAMGDLLVLLRCFTPAINPLKTLETWKPDFSGFLLSAKRLQYGGKKTVKRYGRRHKLY
jgi:hypothetical protein